MSVPTLYQRYPNIYWQTPVATASALPLLGNVDGDVRVTLDTNEIYVWDGVGWLPVASPAAVTAITALLNTSDVTANGPGAVPATVNSVGGSTAASIHSAELAANAATSSNTPNTIVKRDGSGNFSAGTVTASLTGVASGNVTSVSASSPLSSSGGFTPNITITQSSSSVNGFLSSTDWNTFNNKQSALTFGNLTDAGTDGIVITGGTGAVIGTGTSIAQFVATSLQNGYLASSDWTTFNNKAPTNSPAFTGIPTAPTAGVGTSTTQLATTAFVLSQGFTGATGSMPFAYQSSTSVVTSATTTFVTAITTTITTTASSAPVAVKATATLTTTTAASVANCRITVNGVASQTQLVSLTATATNYTAAITYTSTSLGPGTYTVTFDIARSSGTGTVNFFEGALDAIALQGTSSNGITQLTGDVTAGPGSGSQASTIANLAVTNAKIANATISLTTKVTGVLPVANGGTNLSSTTINQLLYSSASNTIAGLATANTGALVTSNTGVPSIVSGSTANRLLRTNGTTVSFAQANLTTDVTGTLPFANGGTGVTSFASGRVIFSGSTTLATDTQFLYDTINNRLTVGTGGGSGTLNVVPVTSTLGLNIYQQNNNHATQIQNSGLGQMLEMIAATGSSATQGCGIRSTISRGTLTARTTAVAGDESYHNGALAYYNSSQTTGEMAYTNYVLTDTPSASANGGEINFATTPNGTTTPVKRVKIANSGETVFSNAIATAQYTTTQKNALTPNPGWVVYDTTLNQLSYYNGTVWVNL